MSETKETFFDLVKEYLVTAQPTYSVYGFEHDDLKSLNWFVEMVWSISKDFDLRIVRESLHDDKSYVFLRTDEPYWMLMED